MNSTYSVQTTHTAFISAKSKMLSKAIEIHNLVHTGTSLQPPAPILHILS